MMDTDPESVAIQQRLKRLIRKAAVHEVLQPAKVVALLRTQTLRQQPISKSLTTDDNSPEIQRPLRRKTGFAQDVSKDTRSLLGLLCPADFRAIADLLLTNYTEVREWFYESPEYLEWVKGRGWSLACCGEPRCGKSTFAAAVAQRIQKGTSATESSIVIPIFLGHVGKGLDYNDTDDRSAKALLRTLLRELIEGQLHRKNRPQILDILPRTESAIKSISTTTLRTWVDEEISKFGKVFLVVDGLDQLPSVDAQRFVRDELSRLSGTGSSQQRTVRLMLVHSQTGANTTGQKFCAAPSCGKPLVLFWQCRRCKDGDFNVCHLCYENGICCSVPGHSMQEPYSNITVQLQTRHEELSRYLRGRLEREIKRDTNLGRRLSEAKDIIENIENTIANKAAGVFILVKLYMDYLSSKQSLDEVLDVLDRLPQHEVDYYNSLMEEVLNQQDKADKNAALAALAILAQERYPLTFHEMTGAISQLLGSSQTSLTEHHLLRITKGLLSLHEFVHPFHETAATYLSEECRSHFEPLQLDMAELCLNCIRLSQSRLMPLKDNAHGMLELLAEMPFLRYSLRYWGVYHAENNTTRGRRAANEFLGDFEKSPSLKQAMFLAISNGDPKSSWCGSDRLHVLAWFGLHHDLRELAPPAQGDINVGDCSNGRTPLHIACAEGNCDMVGNLLGLGADSSVRDSKGQTPLWEATKQGHKEVVLAIANGSSEAFAKSLNTTGPEGQTPAMLAVKRMRRDAGIFKLLLSHPDLDVNIPDELGMTVFHHAALRSNIEALRLLTQADPAARPTQKANHDLQERMTGKTACMIMLEPEAQDGEVVDGKDAVDIIRACLEQGMDAGLQDASGRTLLHYACRNENFEQVVQFLLGPDVDLHVNTPDAHGRTPLHVAASSADCCLGIIDLLKEHDVDVNARDDQGLPATMIATYCGASPEVAADLSLSAAFPDSPIQEQDVLWRAISYAPQNFLDSHGSDLQSLSPEKLQQIDPAGANLLHHAIETKHVDIARSLLTDGRVNKDGVDVMGQTPLQRAIEGLGYGDEPEPELEAIVDLLLEHGADVNVVDSKRLSPLALAAERDLNDMAIKLIKSGARIRLLSEDQKRALLEHAVEKDEPQAAQLLLRAGANVFYHRDSDRLPSQSAAVKRASLEMQKVLQQEEQAVLIRISSPPALPRKDSHQD